MSRVDEMISELCPDGVRRVPVAQVCRVFSGGAFNSKLFNEEGQGIRLVRIRDVNSGHSGTFYSGDFDRRFKVANGDLLIGMDGDFNCVRWQGGDGLLNQRVCRLQDFEDSILPGFLYHLMPDVLSRIQSSTQGSTVKHLSSRELGAAGIPVPPIAVQEEIVRILDTFTELEAELEGELEARTTQYEEIRNRLMAFDDVEVHPLSGLIRELCPEGLSTQELSTLVIRHSGTSITATKMRQLDSPVGEIRVFAGGNTVATVPVDSIPAGDVIETPSVIVKSRGNIGFDYFDRPFSHKSELWSYSSRDSRLNIRFLFHYLESRKFELHALARSKSVKLPQLSVRDTDGLKIPLPPATIQEDIVRILDAFGSLVGDLSSGLPAEIAARRKQYEHYRDKLLSFEDVAA